jgi:signal transduction histidine kinase
MNEQQKVSFSVDAGLINRLGFELVGRAETAVSELIKNAYDADATWVELDFIETNQTGGTLLITDNGSGMTKDQLIDGFMRISSTDKVENPISPIFRRSRAGKKGIGRFATQRLGERLILTTQIKDSETALQITIEWNDYEAKKELSSVKHNIIEVEKERKHGTTLKIEKLRENWSEATIKRVFRYTSELIQPSYLSPKAKELNLPTEEQDNIFEIKFFQTLAKVKTAIADVDKMIFDFAIAKIEGYVGRDRIGYCGIKSERFSLDELYEISSKDEEDIIPFNLIENIHFIAYYFIYNRPDYYDNTVPKMLLNQIQEFSQDKNGLRLYRNGFRVLPYGERNDDWLDLDRRWANASGVISIPFGNKNLFGFIEIIDKNGDLFEETASREGLIENEALRELKYFVYKALVKARKEVQSSKEFKDRKESRDKKQKENKTKDTRPIELKLTDINKDISDSKEELKKVSEKVDGETRDSINKVLSMLDNAEQTQTSVKEDVKEKIEELAMIRVLAGLGMTIGEFVHELQQFAPSFKSDLTFISRNNNNENIKEALQGLENSFTRFRTYTSYFDKTISRNVLRELEPINIRYVAKDFVTTIQADADKSNIKLEVDIKDYDLTTCPMHPSEWSTIFFNFYTNAKKSMRRAKRDNKNILISAYEDKGKVCIEFSDNGEGIKEEYKYRVFDAFFTTSQPNINGIGGELTGTGLGLKIVKDIVDAYNGLIYVAQPLPNYKTTIRIEIPKNKTI